MDPDRTFNLLARSAVLEATGSPALVHDHAALENGHEVRGLLVHLDADLDGFAAELVVLVLRPESGRRFLVLGAVAALPKVDDVLLAPAFQVRVEHDVAVASEELAVLALGHVLGPEGFDAPDLDLASPVVGEHVLWPFCRHDHGRGAELRFLDLRNVAFGLLPEVRRRRVLPGGELRLEPGGLVAFNDLGDSGPYWPPCLGDEARAQGHASLFLLDGCFRPDPHEHLGSAIENEAILRIEHVLRELLAFGFLRHQNFPAFVRDSIKNRRLDHGSLGSFIIGRLLDFLPAAQNLPKCLVVVVPLI
mmetsp:Transcript_23179/g.39815  ORF Transcript_23179/g.39815 Transcript_23179/m.39815 type:complete len:305 (-) Transcript_23179:512-1426(-)